MKIKVKKLSWTFNQQTHYEEAGLLYWISKYTDHHWQSWHRFDGELRPENSPIQITFRSSNEAKERCQRHFNEYILEHIYYE